MVCISCRPNEGSLARAMSSCDIMNLLLWLRCKASPYFVFPNDSRNLERCSRQRSSSGLCNVSCSRAGYHSPTTGTRFMGLNSTTCCQASRGASQGSTRAELMMPTMGRLPRRCHPSSENPTSFWNGSLSACRRLAGNRASAAGAAGADACRMASGHVPSSTTPAPGQEEETRRPRSHSEPTSHRGRRGWWYGFSSGLPLFDRGQQLPAASDLRRWSPVVDEDRAGTRPETLRECCRRRGLQQTPPTAPTREADQREHSDMPEMARQDTGSQARHVCLLPHPPLWKCVVGIVRPRDARPAKHWMQRPSAPSGTGGRRGA